jgi:hypothetical protein
MSITVRLSIPSNCGRLTVIEHIWRSYFPLKYGIERTLEKNIRGRRRRKQLLDDLEEMRIYCKLKDEAIDRNIRRTRFGKGYGHVV